MLDSLAVENILTQKVHILGTLNRGSHGYVHKAKSLIGNELVALKTIDKKSGEEQVYQRRAVENEIMTQRALEHPGVVKVKSFFEDESSFYLVLELCEQGELYKFFPYE
jgi:serine/threonine protein kinase